MFVSFDGIGIGLPQLNTEQGCHLKIGADHDRWFSSLNLAKRVERNVDAVRKLSRGPPTFAPRYCDA
jgi:hypothetical protein